MRRNTRDKIGPVRFKEHPFRAGIIIFSTRKTKNTKLFLPCSRSCPYIRSPFLACTTSIKLWCVYSFYSTYASQHFCRNNSVPTTFPSGVLTRLSRFPEPYFMVLRKPATKQVSDESFLERATTCNFRSLAVYSYRFLTETSNQFWTHPKQCEKSFILNGSVQYCPLSTHVLPLCKEVLHRLTRIPCSHRGGCMSTFEKQCPIISLVQKLPQ